MVPGGADWQFVRPDGVLQIEAKYTLQAADGTLIMVTNRGLHGPPEVIEAGSRRGGRPFLVLLPTSASSAARQASTPGSSARSLLESARRTAAAAIIKFHFSGTRTTTLRRSPYFYRMAPFVRPIGTPPSLPH